MFFQKHLYLTEMLYLIGITRTPWGVELYSPLPPPPSESPVTFQGGSKETGYSMAYEIHLAFTGF